MSGCHAGDFAYSTGKARLRGNTSAVIAAKSDRSAAALIAAANPVLKAAAEVGFPTVANTGGLQLCRFIRGRYSQRRTREQ